MELKDFYIGQVVYYLPPEETGTGPFQGTVTHINLSQITIQYKQDYQLHFGWSDFTYTITKERPGGAKYMTAETPMTPKERVHKRCKDLWNKSNYVKSHPNLKYS